MREPIGFLQKALLLSLIIVFIQPAAAATVRQNQQQQDDAQTLYSKALEQHNAGRYKDAAELFERATTLKPDVAIMHYSLGLARVQSGQYFKSILAFKRAAQLNPKDAAAYSMLGAMYGYHGQHQEAIEALKQAIRLKSDNANDFNNLGIAYYRTGRNEEAIEAYKQALRFAPNNASIYLNLSDAYKKAGRDKEAGEAIKQVVQLRKQNTAAFNSILLNVVSPPLLPAPRTSDSATGSNRLGASKIDAMSQTTAAARPEPSNPNQTNDTLIQRSDGLAAKPATKTASTFLTQPIVHNSTSSTSTQGQSAPIIRTDTPRLNSSSKLEANNNSPTVRWETELRQVSNTSSVPAEKIQAPASAAPILEKQPITTASLAVESKRSSTTKASVAASILFPNLRAISQDEVKAIPLSAAGSFAFFNSELASIEVSPEPPIAPSPLDIYRIGTGDVLDIRLLNDVSREAKHFTVSAGGLLDYPLAGEPVRVAGLTVDEVKAYLTDKLKKRAVYNEPQLTIDVHEYNSHSVIISGLVKESGTKILRREAIPLYVVLADAQLHAEAGRAVVVSHKNGQSTIINLDDTEAMKRLIYPGDVVMVQPRPQQFLYIGGDVRQPGEKAFRPGITLTQAVLSAGGLSISGADVLITVARQGANGHLSISTYRLKEIKSGKSPDPVLEAGDRIEISR